MADVLYEGRHPAEFEVEKFSDNYNHEVVTIAADEVLEPGTVLGKSTTTGKFYGLNPDSTAGMETAAAILHAGVDATGGDKLAVAVTRGPYTANGKEMVWADGMVQADKESAAADLLTGTGIRVLF